MAIITKLQVAPVELDVSSQSSSSRRVEPSGISGAGVGV